MELPHWFTYRCSLHIQSQLPDALGNLAEFLRSPTSSFEQVSRDRIALRLLMMCWNEMSWGRGLSFLQTYGTAWFVRAAELGSEDIRAAVIGPISPNSFPVSSHQWCCIIEKLELLQQTQSSELPGDCYAICTSVATPYYSGEKPSYVQCLDLLVCSGALLPWSYVLVGAEKVWAQPLWFSLPFLSEAARTVFLQHWEPWWTTSDETTRPAPVPVHGGGSGNYCKDFCVEYQAARKVAMRFLIIGGLVPDLADLIVSFILPRFIRSS